MEAAERPQRQRKAPNRLSMQRMGGETCRASSREGSAPLVAPQGNQEPPSADPAQPEVPDSEPVELQPAKKKRGRARKVAVEPTDQASRLRCMPAAWQQ